MTPAKVPAKWDSEYDVVVVGGGTAGLPAALIVKEAGLKPVIIELRYKFLPLDVIVNSRYKRFKHNKHATIRSLYIPSYKRMVAITLIGFS